MSETDPRRLLVYQQVFRGLDSGERPTSETPCSAAALAARAKLTRPYLTQLEAGVREPSIVTVVNLAKALGVPVTALLE